MILRESRKALATYIDYSAAFDTESQIFLDEALSSAGVSSKLRRDGSSKRSSKLLRGVYKLVMPMAVCHFLNHLIYHAAFYKAIYSPQSLSLLVCGGYLYFMIYQAQE